MCCSHPGQQGRSGQSSPLNNLSGSQSSHSSPSSPAQTRAGSSTRNQPAQKEGSVESTSFEAETGVTLQDLTALLSEGHHLPPSMTSSIHGVTHHGGIVINTHHPPPSHPPPHSHSQRHPPAAESQAFMIRPPQQSSRPAAGSDFSFLSDISHGDHSLVLGGPRAERERVQSGDSLRVQQNYVSDRGLELRDLEVDSQSGGVRGDILRVGGAAGSRSRDGLSSVGSGYPPSMSPPVKQGRDGEQDSIDGGMLHETDRLNSSYREISRQLEEHQSRQRELQHYIKLLLDKPPGTGSDQPERDSVTDPDVMDISFGSVVADLGLTDTIQAAQISSELQRLQQLRERQTAAAELSQSARPKSGSGKPDSRRHPPPPSHPRSGGATAAQQQGCGVLAPQQLAEISRLLGQYSEDVEAGRSAVPLSALQANPASMAQVLRFLASLPPQQGGDGGEVSSTKSSPRQQQTRHTREQQRRKKQGDPRHHSVGPDTSLSSGSLAGEKQDRSMASSTRSSTAATTTTSAATRRTDRKSAANSNVSTSSSSSVLATKPGTRTQSREQQQQPPVWK